MVKLENDNLIVEINLVGAAINRIYDKNLDKEYVIPKLDSNALTSKIVHFFPYAGLVSYDQYEFSKENEDLLLEKETFVRKSKFNLIVESKDTCLLSLTGENLLKENDKFVLDFFCEYKLLDYSLELKYNVESKGDKNLSLGITNQPAYEIKSPSESYVDFSGAMKFFKVNKHNKVVNSFDDSRSVEYLSELKYNTYIFEIEDRFEIQIDGNPIVYNLNNMRYIEVDYRKHENKNVLVVALYNELPIQTTEEKDIKYDEVSYEIDFSGN